MTTIMVTSSWHLARSVAVGQEEEGSANGKPNSLTWTLTLTGVLATPFNSVVQLRLFGVTDGFDGFEQYLTVQVKNRPPQLELARTQGIAVFLEQRTSLHSGGGYLQ